MGVILNDSGVALELVRILVKRNLIEFIEQGEVSFSRFKRENSHIINTPDLSVADRKELFELARSSLEIIIRAKRVATRIATENARKVVLKRLRGNT